MTNLSCSVSTCRHNKSDCCCRPEITVGGSNAEKCSETCCADFKKLSNNSSFPLATNSIGAGYDKPNPQLKISCEAKNCKYNQNSACKAESVCVKLGFAGTECSTFVEA